MGSSVSEVSFNSVPILLPPLCKNMAGDTTCKCTHHPEDSSSDFENSDLWCRAPPPRRVLAIYIRWIGSCPRLTFLFYKLKTGRNPIRQKHCKPWVNTRCAGGGFTYPIRMQRAAPCAKFCTQQSTWTFTRKLFSGFRGPSGSYLLTDSNYSAHSDLHIISTQHTTIKHFRGGQRYQQNTCQSKQQPTFNCATQK